MSQDAKEVFLKAVELADPQQRVKLLDHLCSDNPELRRRVEALLQAHDEPGSFMEEPPAELAKTYKQTKPIAEKPGTMIGPYKLLQQIGEGGFGIVYMAEQAEPIRRKVALKIIKPGMDTKDVIARFEAERQALALMDHPNIARVFDAGSTEQGRPYFVMELVKGIPLIKFCDENKLSVEARLELFVTICRAIQHAHHKGIIHRDIKPSNIMITMHDGEPVPKVIDFGVSKALSQQLTEKTLFTAYGQMIGTPSYMSPEQAEMSGLDVDTRSDIYSLGVLLYELLTGSTPITAERLRKSGYAEMQKLIREEEPEKPSLRLSTQGDATASIATKRGIEPKRLSAFVRGDLDWIVMKALEKNRDRRYETASNFATDIDRFLKHEAVEASPPSARYKLRKYIQKNKTALSIMATISTILSVATFVSTLMVIQAVKAEDKLKESLARETIAREYAEGQKERADAQRQKADLERRRANEALKETRKTIDKYVETVQNAELLKEERFKPLMKKLLKDAMDHYRNFIENHKHDALELYDLAVALTRIAKFSIQIDDIEKAIEANLKANEIWEKLAAKNPKQGLLSNQVAINLNNVGLIYINAGKPKKALESLEKAHEILVNLVKRNPAVTKFLQMLANNHNTHGMAYDRLERSDEAFASYKKAISIMEKLVKENPNELPFKQVLALSYNNIGGMYGTNGQSNEAIKFMKKALEIQKQVAENDPYQNKHWEDLARSHSNIGLYYQNNGKLDITREQYQKAFEIREKLARKNPTVTEYQRALAVSHNLIGRLHKASGKMDEALLSLKKSLEILKKLADENPGSTKSMVGLGVSYVELANYLRSQEDYEQATGYYDLGIETLEKAIDKNSSHRTARKYLRNAYWRRAGIKQALKQFEACIADLEKAIEYDSGPSRNRLRVRLAFALVKTENYSLAYHKARKLAEENQKRPTLQYNMACVVSMVCEAVQKDETLSQEKKAELTSQYSEEAIGFLKTAKSLGFFEDPKHRELLLTDHDLDALREIAEFQKLLKEISANSAGADPVPKCRETPPHSAYLCINDSVFTGGRL